MTHVCHGVTEHTQTHTYTPLSSLCLSYTHRFFWSLSKGGTKDCDHWHQGAGFVTSHMTLTLMFEQSLQAVNPAVSVPYWDFTLESTFFGSSDFRTSGVFADDWFGEASTTNVREIKERETVRKQKWTQVCKFLDDREGVPPSISW